MSAALDSQIHPFTLAFRSKWLEHAYGEWGIDRLKTNYYGGLTGSAFLMMVLGAVNCLILGRFEWVIFWTYGVGAVSNCLLWGLFVKFGKVDNRSKLDIYGAGFIAGGQIWQFVAASAFPELGGQYLLVIIILSLMGNCGFTSINMRFILPIVFSVMIVYMIKVSFFDDLPWAEWVFHVTMVIVFTSIGATSGYLMEKSTRMNFLAQSVLERKQQELISKNKELEQFAYIASHDLQEPLRSVTSFSELINEEYRDQLGEDGGQYLDYLMEASGRMRNLIRGLLDYSRLGREAQLGPVNAQAVLNAILVDLNTAIKESGSKITSTGLPQITGYETEFRQLLQNLISNAMKFRKAGMAPEIHVSANRKGNEWEFSVRDNGIGIEPEHQERIFLIFQRIHNRSLYEGTGIGLANCRKIVELHGGTIRVESEKGKGSNFLFTIPIR
jgi:signal transduction histidine kinase